MFFRSEAACRRASRSFWTHTPDADGLLKILLKARRTVPRRAPALLHAGHQVLQVLGEVLVLVAEEVDLQSRAVDLRAVLTLGHAVPDPQHLDGRVVVRVHEVQKAFHELLAQERCHLSGESVVVSQNDVQEHEEAVDRARVLQVDLHVQRCAGDGFSARSDGVNSSPGQHRPPEPHIALLLGIDGSPNLFIQGPGSISNTSTQCFKRSLL